MRRIILASNSPRRKEILTKGNIDFTVVKSNYKEESFKFYKESFIKKNSLYKALDVAERINYPAIIIGADTMVILDSVCLLKPADFSKAFLMLKNLSGKTHRVITSISLVDSTTKQNLTETCTTFVTFRELNDTEIKNYLNTFKPFDKAGSYGIQDFLSIDEINSPPKNSFIQKINGDYYNVMGISLVKLTDLLKQFCQFN